MTKDFWWIKYEKTAYNLAAGEITREEAVRQWVHMGLDRDKAECEADDALGLV